MCHHEKSLIANPLNPLPHKGKFAFTFKHEDSQLSCILFNYLSYPIDLTCVTLHYFFLHSVLCCFSRPIHSQAVRGSARRAAAVSYSATAEKPLSLRGTTRETFLPRMKAGFSVTISATRI